MSDILAPESEAAPAQDSFVVESNTTPDGGAAESDASVDASAPSSPPDEEPSADAASEAASTLNQKKRSLEGRKATYQQQINDLARQRGEMQRAFEAERREYESLRAQAEQARPVAPAEVDPRAPQEDQFETYGQFVQAAARYAGQQAVYEAQQQHQQQQEQHDRQRWHDHREATHTERLESFRTSNPGFDVAVNREDINLSTPMVDVIKASDVGPALMLHMAHYPDDAQRMSVLHPVLAYGEMKALEARLSVAHGSTAPSTQVSKARPPIRPVGSTPSGSVDDPSEMAFGAEYVSRMNKLDRDRRRR